MRRVSRRPEPRQIPSVQIPPVQIPDVPEPVQIPHVPEPPVQIPDVLEPLAQIPDVPEPPVQIPPEPIPELDTLELTNAASIDQLMSFVFGEEAQELQLLHTVPSIFDGDLISFLDEFERECAPMDLIMPRLNPCANKSIGFKAIQSMDLSCQ
ncbi:hypothetical protein TNCV_2285261 [Trichonephila clavipes]|nr:hypothetical protein TNCV_2285261 [Trichonephila clavipes]